jgi:hypothetical protein
MLYRIKCLTRFVLISCVLITTYTYLNRDLLTQNTLDINNIIENAQYSHCSKNNTSWTSMHNDDILIYSTYVKETRYKLHIQFLVYKTHCRQFNAIAYINVNNVMMNTTCTFIAINLMEPKCTRNVGFDWRYEAYYIKCELEDVHPHNETSMTIQLQIDVNNSTSDISDALQFCYEKVEDDEHDIEINNNKTNIALCTSALFDYKNWRKLILFIEYYNLIGVNTFLIYVHSTSKDVSRVLQYYEHTVKSKSYKIL